MSSRHRSSRELVAGHFLSCFRAVWCLLLIPASASAEEKGNLPSFTYLLQTAPFSDENREACLETLAKCDRDVVVIDSSFDGSPSKRWTAAEVALIRDGRPGRKVYSYLSIGEAGTYRGYWKKTWDADLDGEPDSGQAPDWLLSANPHWRNNYRVRYWEPRWHELLGEALDRMIAQGFDGVWLDTVDTFEFFEHDAENNRWIDNRPNPKSGNTYREDMIALVAALVDRAGKSGRTIDFATNNGTQLLVSEKHRKRLAYVGLENLFTNGAKKQPKGHVSWLSQYLDLADEAGIPVLAVEYPTMPELTKYARVRAAERGYSLLVAEKELMQLGEAFLPRNP